MNGDMTDKQLDTLLLLLADVFENCESLKEVHAWSEFLHKMAQHKTDRREEEYITTEEFRAIMLRLRQLIGQSKTMDEALDHFDKLVALL